MLDDYIPLYIRAMGIIFVATLLAALIGAFLLGAWIF